MVAHLVAMLGGKSVEKMVALTVAYWAVKSDLMLAVMWVLQKEKKKVE